MILAVLILVIIVLIYNNFYSYYARERTHRAREYMKKTDACAVPTPCMTHKQMHAQSPDNTYTNAQDYQEQSRRTREDVYNMDSKPLPVSEEYMTDKYDKSYMQSIASAPSADNYNEYMISTGLESGVVSSHKEFVDETQNKTSGASTETVFSHDDSIVPSWGLRRHSAAIPINPNSREVPSQTNEQLADNAQPFKYGLF
jgi:hypothetical protein